MAIVLVLLVALFFYHYGWNKGYDHRKRFEEELNQIDPKSRFYLNCKRQRQNDAKICQDCPFRARIRKEEERWQSSTQ